MILSWLLARKAVSTYRSMVLVGAPLCATLAGDLQCVPVGNRCPYWQISRDQNGDGQQRHFQLLTSSCPVQLFFTTVFLFCCAGFIWFGFLFVVVCLFVCKDLQLRFYNFTFYLNFLLLRVRQKIWKVATFVIILVLMRIFFLILKNEKSRALEFKNR